MCFLWAKSFRPLVRLGRVHTCALRGGGSAAPPPPHPVSLVSLRIRRNSQPLSHLLVSFSALKLYFFNHDFGGELPVCSPPPATEVASPRQASSPVQAQK